MKLIDQTPFFDENGDISFFNRLKATVQFGGSWLKEMEAQRTVLSALNKVLDKKFTLLRNLTPPGLNTQIPFILVGPTGVYVMYVNPKTGMFSARGDQWGVISGGSLAPEKPNLLARTERMARAVQVLLQRQGYAELTNVEAVMLCSDPGANVDSVRPIIRVVMRDALERFAVSVAQGRVILNPESVFDIVNRIQNPTAPPSPKLVEAAATNAATAAAEQADKEYVPGSEALVSETPASMAEPAVPETEFLQPQIPPELEPAATDVPLRKRFTMSRKQWIFLVTMFLIWVIILIIFGFVIARDFLL